MRTKNISTQRGFTLIELAVVLIIIGLIVGGVVASQSMIRQAELRSVMAEYDMYTKAAKEFRDKYQALPGDMVDATGIWPTGSCPLAYTSAILVDPGTCNGDGDGLIGNCTGSSADGLTCGAGDMPEIWLFWQHLSYAEFIEGTFSGAQGAAGVTYRASIGLNAPASARTPAGWTLLYLLNPDTTTPLVGDYYGHVFLFGGDKGAENGKFTTAPVIYVSEALNIDEKMDDGVPITGMVRAWDDFWYSSSGAVSAGNGDTSYCVDDFLDPAIVYHSSLPDTLPNVCSLIFIPGL